MRILITNLLTQNSNNRRTNQHKNNNHFTGNSIFFFQTTWKDDLSKKIVLEYDLSCIIGKDDISFSRKYDLRRKMKDDLSPKYTEIWYFLEIFWKDGIFKKGRVGTWSFLYYLKRWCFFSRKHDIFSLGRKWEMTFLKK